MDNFCNHGFTFGYCKDRCLKFASVKEKIQEDRRLFLEQFNQAPAKLETLLKRKRWPIMPTETKISFIQRLIQLHRLERQAKY